jgi:hypothetical protein
MVEGGDQKPDRGNVVLGYAVGVLAVVLATIGVVAMIASFGSDSDGGASEPDPSGDVTVREEADRTDLLPEGGTFQTPDDTVESVAAAARDAGCELKRFRATSRAHAAPDDPPVRYRSNPPTSGKHDPVPAPDGAYSESPDVEKLVHTLEHSRVIVWFKRTLPLRARASLKAYYDHDSGLMVLVPDTTGMDYDVAATAWTRNPGKDGTGRLLGCRDYDGDVFTALQAFKKAYRGRGLELVP